jgi:hypothetical protein
MYPRPCSHSHFTFSVSGGEEAAGPGVSNACSGDCVFPSWFPRWSRGSESIYGNSGSPPSRCCPLESFKWFVRNPFPRRDDLDTSTQHSHWGPHSCSRVWLLAWGCPRERCDELSPAQLGASSSLASCRGHTSGAKSQGKPALLPEECQLGCGVKIYCQ